MNALKLALLSSILLTLFCCTKNKEPNNTGQIKHEILKMFDDYHAAIKKGGLQAEFEYLDKSSDFFWVPPGYTSALTYDSVKNILIQNSTTIKSIEFSWDTLQVFPLAHDLASYSGIVVGNMTDTTNSHSTFKIIESGTLIKRKDGWKLLNGQSRNLIEATKDSL